MQEKKLISIKTVSGEAIVGEQVSHETALELYMIANPAKYAVAAGQMVMVSLFPGAPICEENVVTIHMDHIICEDPIIGDLVVEAYDQFLKEWNK